MGEEKRPPADERPKRDDGEPTPIFDAVFNAMRARANTADPAREPEESPR
ncbi:hypothetical protein [Amycolatopsis sp. cmx-4-61]